MLALVLALGATPLAVYADDGDGTTQSETSNVSEVSETGETKQLKAGEIRVQTSDGFKIYDADNADKFREFAITTTLEKLCNMPWTVLPLN